MKPDLLATTFAEVTMPDFLRVLKCCSFLHFDLAHRRIDGEHVLRNVWKVKLVEQTKDLILNSQELESKWEGFTTEEACLADMYSVVSTWIRLNATVKVKKTRKVKQVTKYNVKESEV
jgi:hypothetical protein